MLQDLVIRVKRAVRKQYSAFRGWGSRKEATPGSLAGPVDSVPFGAVATVAVPG